MTKSQCSATTQDGSISCPYHAARGADKCLFHLPPLERVQRGISQADFHALIQDMVQSHGVFILFNTSLGIIDLSQIDTGKLDTIILKNVRIESLTLPERQVEAAITIGNSSIGTLTGDDRTYHSQLTLSGCEIRQCLFRSATLIKQVQILGCVISKAAEFGSAVFKDILLLSKPEYEIQDHRTDWDSDLSSAAEATQFYCTANFSATTFHEFARFTGCKFKSGAHFDNLEANTTLNFSGTQFRYFANFRMSEFYSDIDCTNATFEYATFEECHFHGNANFSNAVFRGSGLKRLSIARGLGSHIASEGATSQSVGRMAASTKNLHLLNSPVGTDWDLNMNECTVDEALLLKPISYESSICLQHAEFGNLHLQAMAADNGVVGIDDSKISSGDIRFFDDSNPSVTVEHSTIGNVGFYGIEGVNPFENLYFGNTKFDGFGFDSHRMFFEDMDWNIVETADRKPYSGRESEQQFVNARVAASQDGDDYAAAQFFVKEKRNRRRRHLNEASEGAVTNRIASVYNWLSNLILDLLCKYGESSRRLLGVGLLTILAYAGFYSWIDVPLNYGIEPILVNPVTLPVADFTLNLAIGESLAYLLFSAEVFTTFVLSSPSVNDPTVRVATASEGLVGALFVALLVFTLTKSLHR